MSLNDSLQHSRKTSWQIRDVKIPNALVIAPMAGVSNIAFRSICKRFGAGLVCAEMVSDKALYYENGKTLHMTRVMEDEHPMSLQIFGHDIDSMVYAAKLLDEQSDCDIIDINMGCPVNKVIKAKAGSALMREPAYAQTLVEQIVQAVKKPVTVKFRSGFDSEHINAVEFARRMEAAGASALCIHGRTRAQMYEGKADWSIIRQVKQAVNIPVIGNGDVRSVADMERMMEETGVDAVAIGRGVLGDPWLIRQCAHYLETGEQLPPVSCAERFAIAREHAQRLIDLKGEVVGMKEMRGHGAWYIKGLPGSHPVKEQISRVETYAQFDEILRTYEERIREWEQHAAQV